MATIEELETTLPNGLHDTRLLRLTIDYGSRQVVMGPDLLVNDERRPDAARTEESSRRMMRREGLYSSRRRSK